MAGLEGVRVEAGSRPLRVRPSATLLSFEENAACFEFRLPAGSFATSVLREVAGAAVSRDGAAL
jgi:tRNA(Glu) U13 pseudouridine synthase TruD